MPQGQIQFDSKSLRAFPKELSRLYRNGIINTSARSLKSSSDDLAFVAQELAPVKSGALESAIEPIAVSKNYDTAEVVAGVTVRGDKYSSIDKVYTEDYAEEAHSQITPFGPKNLGPKSRLKNDALTGISGAGGVGGGFMSRAYDYMEPKIIEAIENALENSITVSQN